MKSKLTAWFSGAAVAGAVAVSAATWAMGPQGGMEPDPDRMIGHMSKQLDLSAEQQAQVESLLGKARESGADDHRRMQELRRQMTDMRDNFDASKARKAADEIGQLTGRMVYRASETWSQVYQLLNAEQKTTLDGLMAKRDERRGKWREGGAKPE